MPSVKYETHLPRFSALSLTLCSSPVTPELAKTRNNQLFLRLGQKPAFSCKCGTSTSPHPNIRQRQPTWTALGPAFRVQGEGVARKASRSLGDSLCHLGLAVSLPPTAAGS